MSHSFFYNLKQDHLQSWNISSFSLLMAEAEAINLVRSQTPESPLLHSERLDVNWSEIRIVLITKYILQHWFWFLIVQNNKKEYQRSRLYLHFWCFQYVSNDKSRKGWKWFEFQTDLVSQSLHIMKIFQCHFKSWKYFTSLLAPLSISQSRTSGVVSQLIFNQSSMKHCTVSFFLNHRQLMTQSIMQYCTATS